LGEVLSWFGYLGGGVCREIDQMLIGVEDAPVNYRVNLLPVSPNPMRGEGRIRFTLVHDGPASVAVYDLRGRLVRMVFDGPASEGENLVVWDGRDASAHPVASGVYFYKLRTSGTELARKLVVVGGR